MTSAQRRDINDWERYRTARADSLIESLAHLNIAAASLPDETPPQIGEAIEFARTGARGNLRMVLNQENPWTEGGTI